MKKYYGLFCLGLFVVFFCMYLKEPRNIDGGLFNRESFLGGLAVGALFSGILFLYEALVKEIVTKVKQNEK